MREISNKNISIVGIGYVGLALAVLLARDNKVTAIDIAQEKVDKINELIPFTHDALINKYFDEAKRLKTLYKTENGNRRSAAN